MEEIRFDDIAALQKHVSEEFGEFCEPVEVTQDMVNQFADVTGDHQWIHIEELGSSEWLEISQDRVNSFADTTLDHQWIHVDVERCKKESPFGGPIAHGFLTLSLLPMLNAKGKPAYKTVGVKNAVNYGSDKLRFLSPVPVPSKLHARSRRVSVEAGKRGVRMEQETAIHVVGSERPAVLYNMITQLQG